MTNRQYLAGLSDEALAKILSAECPLPNGAICRYQVCPCSQCWLDWLRAEYDKKKEEG